MTHRIDPRPRRVKEREPRRKLGISESSSATVHPPVVVAVSLASITVSLVLMTLSVFGVADVLPTGVRAVLVCFVALVLPGLPAAALLRLPLNGVFASVTVALSLSTNILLAQANIVAGLQAPYLAQFVLLGVTGVLTGLVARRWWATPNPIPEPWLAAVVARLRTRPARERLPSIGLLVLAIVLFASTLARLDTRAAGRAGLIGIVGVEFFIALALVGVVLAVEYRRPVVDRITMAASNVVLIAFVTMPVAWADRTAPFPTAYAHRNIINWISTLGTLPPPVDARMSWAGFFSAVAQMMKVSGIDDSAVFLTSASFVFSVLMIFPVYAIGLSISRSRRVAWLGVTVYILFNWYQQDYFAPQAVAMFFYATIISVLLWQLRDSEVPALDGGRIARYTTAWARIPGRVAGRDARWTLAMEFVLVVIITAMVIEHQLTPLVLIAALLLFSVTGLTRHKMLWLIALLVFVAWFAYGASGFWQGHLGEIISEIGGLDQNLKSSVSGRIAGDPLYDRMQYLRISASLLLFALAGLSWLRMPRRACWPMAGALAVAPFALVLVQSYGGEVAIRCFLYASALLAPLAALSLRRLVLPAAKRRRPWLLVTATAVLITVMSMWVTTNRGLNTSFERTTQEALQVSDGLLRHVEPGQLTFWGQGLAYALPGAAPFEDECYADAQAIVDCTDAADIQYFVDTDQDDKYLHYRYGFPATEVDNARQLLSEKGFELMYDGDEVRVYKRDDAPRIDVGERP